MTTLYVNQALVKPFPGLEFVNDTIPNASISYAVESSSRTTYLHTLQCHLLSLDLTGRQVLPPTTPSPCPQAVIAKQPVAIEGAKKRGIGPGWGLFTVE